jgi:1-deoxy-D-xylulose-5-phosphate synthase
MDLKILPAIQSPADLKALPVEKLPELAAEIRSAICAQIMKTGGHFAPNLGVVELTLALHYVFDLSHDRLLFDVGHQCYPHKLVTGRFGMLPKLRQTNGMAGFPDPRESDYDLFSVGHAGTAISTAVGMARGDTLRSEGFCPKSNPEGRRVVALVGDASIVNGVAMEGMNNAGTLKRQFLVVFNDNGMSIAKPQGAIAAYFDRIRINPAYRSVKKAAKDVVKRLPGGSVIGEMYHRLGEMAKDAIAEDTWFEKFGLVTVGPVDGHDLKGLIDILLEVKDPSPSRSRAARWSWPAEATASRPPTPTPSSTSWSGTRRSSPARRPCPTGPASPRSCPGSPTGRGTRGSASPTPWT